MSSQTRKDNRNTFVHSWQGDDDDDDDVETVDEVEVRAYFSILEDWQGDDDEDDVETVDEVAVRAYFSRLEDWNLSVSTIFSFNTAISSSFLSSDDRRRRESSLSSLRYSFELSSSLCN